MDEVLEQETTTETQENDNQQTDDKAVVDETKENKSEENSDKGTDDADKTAEKSESEDADKKEVTAPDSYNYSEIKLPEGMQLDQDIVNKFDPIARKNNLTQEQANEIVGLAVELVGKQSSEAIAQLQKTQEATIAHYQQLLNTDEEIGAGDKAKMDAYLDVADIGYGAVANETVKGLLKDAGLNFHPEFVKMFHRIGDLCKDDNLPDVKTPSGKEQSAADILYGSESNE